jgi:hypothetical protein
MDGLWDLVIVGVFFLLGAWGVIYVRFVAFHSSTWPTFQGLGNKVPWLGLLILIIALVIFIGLSWLIVKQLKRRYISPYIGHVEHSFFLPMDRKVFVWYFFLYVIGLSLLYGLFSWAKGGPYMMSVPFIISPAAILWGIGKVYGIRRYRYIAVIGLVLALFLELLLTTQADYLNGPRNFLDVLPTLGCPTLPCIVWGGLFLVSGLIGLVSVRRLKYGAN